MRWWHVASIVLLLALAVLLVSQPAGPHGEITQASNEPFGVKIYVLDENGTEINAYVWQKGLYWCARAEGFVEDCAREKNGVVYITLRRDPTEKRVLLEANGCAFMAMAPAGMPLVGPKPCGALWISPGRYEIAFFDENGALVDRREVFVRGSMVVIPEGNAVGGVGYVRNIDQESLREMNAWVSFGRIALLGTRVPVSLKTCGIVHSWAEEHKLMDIYMCPGEEATVTLPRQVNGGHLIVSAPAAEWLLLTDRNGDVYTMRGGSEAELTEVPPGVYMVYAVKGAAYTVRQVDVGTDSKIVEIEDIRGYATIDARRPVQIFAMGEKIGEGTGKIRVPARTALHIIVLEPQPAEETIVLLPGEVRII